MTEITAAVFRDHSGQPSMEALELSGPGPGEVLVKTVATGVCHTDLKTAQSQRSPRPVVLGHEGAGIVEAVGDGITDLEPGDHVVMAFNSCGACPSCLNAHPAYCYHEKHFHCQRDDGSFYLDGEFGPVYGDFFNQSSFATHAIAHRRRGVVKVRKDAPLELLGPLGCGLMTGAGAVFNDLNLRPGQSIAVYGAGSLGLAAIMAARISGAGKIIAVDVHQNRLDLAEELGADVCFNAAQGPASKGILQLLPDGVDHALDTSAVESVMLEAISVLAPRGTFCFVAPPDSGELTLPMRPLMQGRKVIGTIDGDGNPDIFIPQLVDYFMTGVFPIDKLVRFYDFEHIGQAFEDSHKGITVKPVLRMPD